MRHASEQPPDIKTVEEDQGISIYLDNARDVAGVNRGEARSSSS